LHATFHAGEPAFERKARAATKAKARLAELALGLVPSGATVFVDAGTTTLELGRLLLERDDLTIFTNSLPLLNVRRAGKAALMQLTKTTGVLYAERGVRLNCVAPGLVFTPLVKRLADKYAKGDFEGFVAHRHKQVPAGYMGDAWDVANTVVFLASDEARYITGQTIVVDGGLTSTTP
jgi:hypothetical protein